MRPSPGMASRALGLSCTAGTVFMISTRRSADASARERRVSIMPTIISEESVMVR